MTVAAVIVAGGSGLGAGSRPDKGREAAEMAADEIRNAIDGAHHSFVVATFAKGTYNGSWHNKVLPPQAVVGFFQVRGESECFFGIHG